MSRIIPVGDDLARTMFDIAVESMDFGSGFLDDAEVESLRAFAVLIGVDPMLGTPDGFRTKYAHDFEPLEITRWITDPADRLGGIESGTEFVCRVCREHEDHRVHHGVSGEVVT